MAWDAIVLSSNKQGGKLSGGDYVKAIYLGSIIRGQFSGWQLPGGNYPYSIILWGNSLTDYCPRFNYLGAVTGDTCFGGAIIRGAIIRRTIILGAIVRVAIIRRTIILGGSYPGGNCPVP